ncbi:putative bifunctional diguanylate cyclase/phosphodiesterase [Mycobacterium sp. SA01]|uniref:putative bifunctional diguanylate cyclase/phosphodiesterase n=1 Tax=Mycobacterium sp. SA01 TaxID=3238820 RepID=UPI00351AC59C
MGNTDPATLLTIIRVQDAINDADLSGRAVMQIVVDQARQATDAPGAVIELADGDDMVYTVTSGSLCGTEGLRLARYGSLSGEATRLGKALISGDTETDTRVDTGACRRVGARSMIVVPLIAEDRVQGVLKVISGQPNAFGDATMSLLEQLAHFIGRALQRAAFIDEKTRELASDSLTGLANRAAFLAALNDWIASAAASAHTVAVVLYAGLDGLTQINHAFGQAAGDEVLREVGRRVSSTCPPQGLAARLGGVEFAALLASSPPAEPRTLCERLAAELKKPVGTSAGSVTVGANCGSATVRGGDLAEAVIVRADAAMHAAKRGTDAALTGTASRDRREFENLLSRAITEGRLVAYAQPIVDARTGQVVEEELLVRMIAADGHAMVPDEFLPQARQFGLMPTIDQFMVAQGIECAKAGRPVAVNISSASINDTATSSAILEHLRQAGDAARRVSFEITEHAALASTDLAERFSDEMGAMGCRLALDDFGTGFGSLTELRGMMLSKLKIDKSFVSGMLRNVQDELVIRAIVAVAREFGLLTVAEGVEDAKTRNRLVELGIDQLQGYLLGRPEPVLATPR